MYQLTKKFTLCLAILTLLTIHSTAVAKVKTLTGQLSLMATLDGKPAFRSVLWKLTPNSRSTDVKTILIHKHAATLDLAPGSYQISASLDNKTRTHYVTIKESSKQALIVSLD